MACNNCKKKKIETQDTTAQNLSFELRSGISFDQINMANPSDEIILRFLNENPNRISLFSKFPENWLNNEKENSNG